MQYINLLVSVAVLAVGASSHRSNCVASAATRPISAPATAPSKPKADLSTPLGALRSYYVALNQGDPEMMRQVLYANDKVTKQYASALIEVVTSIRCLKSTSKKAFGREVHHRFGSPGADPAGDATAEIKGNRATVQQGENSIPFIRAEKQWKLALPEIKEMLQYPGFIPRWQRVAAAWRALAKDIRSGKYKTITEVETAMVTVEKKVICETNREYSSHPTSQSSGRRSGDGSH